MTGGTYDFWLLDLDGTVVDVRDAYVREVMAEVGARLGCGLTDGEARRLWYEVEDERDAVLASRGVDRAEFWRVYHDVEDPLARAEATYVYDDAAQFLAGVDAPVGVVTHCQSYLTGPVLETLDIADWFDAVVCCSDETGWKPDPRPVRIAMADLEVDSGDQAGALAGDAPADVGAARNAGLDAVHVDRRGAVGPDPPLGADRRIRSLTALAR